MRMETDASPYQYEPYSMVDFELPNIMSRAINQQQSLHTSPLADPQLQLCTLGEHAECYQHLEIESLDEEPFDEWGPNHHHGLAIATTTPTHSSTFQSVQTWSTHQVYPRVSDAQCEHTRTFDVVPVLPYAPNPTSYPQTQYQYLDEGHVGSPWSSSSDFTCNKAIPSIEEDDEALDDKPYAILIYEALMQAPGHRMHLRDIYEWFRHNTSKAQDPGSSGWQNSIRHNLSMNKAFENDRDQSSSTSRKVNSVWVLTDEAIKNGVQSTTRYRKTGAGKKPLGSRAPAIQRQRSGAKGGRAARRTAARQRYQEQYAPTDHTPSGSTPSTPYSDYSEYPGSDYHDLQPAIRSWPMSPVEVNLGDEAIMQHHDVPSLNKLDLGSNQHFSYLDDTMHFGSALLQPTRDQQVNELVRFHAD